MPKSEMKSILDAAEDEALREDLEEDNPVDAAAPRRRGRPPRQATSLATPGPVVTRSLPVMPKVPAMLPSEIRFTIDRSVDAWMRFVHNWKVSYPGYELQGTIEDYRGEPQRVDVLIRPIESTDEDSASA